MSLGNSRSVGQIVPPLLESLEERLLLTTLIGGDVFEYAVQDTGLQWHLVRVALRGDIIAEFIAAGVDYSDNTPIVGNVGGYLLSSETGRTATNLFGGLNGAYGVRLIGPTPIADPAYQPGNLPYIAAGSDLIAIRALASRDASGGGQTFGFNVAGVPVGTATRSIVQLLQLSNANGNAVARAMLQQASLREDVMSNLDTPDRKSVV
jgi:hypothetical protein